MCSACRSCVFVFSNFLIFFDLFFVRANLDYFIFKKNIERRLLQSEKDKSSIADNPRDPEAPMRWQHSD